MNPSRETKLSGTHGDRGIFIFPVQLTTSRIGNLIRLIHTLLYVMTIHTFIHTYSNYGIDTKVERENLAHVTSHESTISAEENITFIELWGRFGDGPT